MNFPTHQEAKPMEDRPWYQWYEEGIPREVDFEEKPITEYLRDTTLKFPNRTALIFENCRMTYAEFDENAYRLSAALSGMGVGKDSRVAIHLPNLPQTVIAYYAVLRLGAQVVMTNPLYVEREIEHQWNDANVETAIVGDWLYTSRLQGLRDKLPTKNFIVTGIADFLGFPLNWIAPLKLWWEGLAARVPPGPGIHHFKSLLERYPPAAPKGVFDLDDLALLQYTGGTTGVSKGAMLTHRNLSFNVQQVVQWFPSLKEGEETWLSCLPFFHVFGMTVAMNFPVRLGGTMVLMPNPRDIAKMVSNLCEHRVTVYPALPALFNAIIHYPGIDKLDITSVKGCFSGSAPLPLEVLEEFERMSGGKIVEGFGLTETSPVTHCNPVLGKRKSGSIGIPLPSTDAKIVDLVEGKKEMPVGEEGELIISGPQCMKGYWNMPEETKYTLRDNWIYTGDLSKMDEDGYFWIVGRKKDMIVASGYNIYPNEIDAVLFQHPKVLEAATIGIPDPKRGETVKSFVVLKPGESASETEIIEFCRKELAAYKVPKSIEFRSELPKSAIQKILRRKLREEEIAKSKRAPAAS
jgi:long-chain acyl-CoA synthetase